MIKSRNLANILLNQIERRKKNSKIFSLLFFLLSRSAVEGMDGSERKEKNERQQAMVEREGEKKKERDNGAVGKKERTTTLQNKSSTIIRSFEPR